MIDQDFNFDVRNPPVIICPDFETLSLDSDAVIIGMGSTVFSPGGPHRNFVSAFPINALGQVGRRADPDTVNWWSVQPDNGLRLCFQRAMAGDGPPLQTVLHKFLEECKTIGGERGVWWLFKPSCFDGALFRHACVWAGLGPMLEEVGLGASRRRMLDLQSIRFGAAWAGIEVPENVKAAIQHHPVQDAMAQGQSGDRILMLLRDAISGAPAASTTPVVDRVDESSAPASLEIIGGDPAAIEALGLEPPTTADSNVREVPPRAVTRAVRLLPDVYALEVYEKASPGIDPVRLIDTLNGRIFDGEYWLPTNDETFARDAVAVRWPNVVAGWTRGEKGEAGYLTADLVDKDNIGWKEVRWTVDERASNAKVVETSVHDLARQTGAGVNMRAGIIAACDRYLRGNAFEGPEPLPYIGAVVHALIVRVGQGLVVDGHELDRMAQLAMTGERPDNFPMFLAAVKTMISDTVMCTDAMLEQVHAVTLRQVKGRA